MKLKKILATTDFSDLSRQAFPAAAALARRFGAELHVVHMLDAVPPEVFFSAEGVQTYSPDVDMPLRVREALARLVADEPSFAGLDVKTHLLQGGDVQERLIRFQREHAIDLTLVSTHGRGGLQHFFLGSFAEKVVRLSSTPVLTYRKREGATGFEPRRILVPYDFSEHSRATLDAVRFFAEAFHSAVRLQHVLELLPDLALIPWEEIPAEEIESRRAGAPERGKAELQSIIAEAFAGMPDVDAVADFGTPFVDIVRGARDFDADLIIMATHGWTGIRHMLLGSVAEKVVRKAPCSVLTIRPAGITFEHP